MSWNVHHINVPSTDVQRDAQFFEEIGLRSGVWIYPEAVDDLHHDQGGMAYFGTENHGLHIVRVVPEFAAERGFWHNPTVGGHFALNVDDVPSFLDRCRAANLTYTDAGTYAMDGVHQSYVFDPAANLIEINSTRYPLSPAQLASQSQDTAIAIAGIVVPTLDTGLSLAFYQDLVGLGPPVANHAGKIVRFVSGQNTLSLTTLDLDYPGKHNPTIVGCFQLRVDDLDSVSARLNAGAYQFSDLPVDPILGERVLYVFTPSARLVALQEARLSRRPDPLAGARS